ncbi:MAG: hypothetical protein AB1445_13535 [Bacillota bacterium]
MPARLEHKDRLGGGYTIASLADLKMLVQAMSMALSPENRRLITGILDEMAKEGGITAGNRRKIERPVRELAAQNGIDIEQLMRKK